MQFADLFLVKIKADTVKNTVPAFLYNSKEK